jgi:hypothetical protein
VANWNNEAAQLQNANADLLSGYTEGLNAATVPQEAFESMPLEALATRAQSFDSGTLREIALSWSKIHDELFSISNDISGTVMGLDMSQMWTGECASAVARGLDEFNKKVVQLTIATAVVQNKLGQGASMLEDTQARMPVPSGSDDAEEQYTVEIPVAGALKRQEGGKDEAEQQARAAFADYRTMATEVGAKSPVMPTSPAIVQSTPSTQVSSAGYSGIGSAGGGAGLSKAGTSGTNDGNGQNSRQQSPGAAQQQSPGQSGDSAGAQPDSSRAAAASAMPQTSAAGWGGSATPFGPGDSGGPDLYDPATWQTGPGVGQPGGQGSGGQRGGGGYGGSGGRGVAGQSGMPGLGGMGRGKGGQDKEHKSADYLRSTKHLDEWLSDDRAASPAVIGKQYDFNDPEMWKVPPPEPKL